MTADAYLQHQSYKQCNITTDPLADFLNNINRNPAAYKNKQSLNSVTEDEKSNGKINDKSAPTGGGKHRTIHQKDGHQ